jgi:hypothetical protein
MTIIMKLTIILNNKVLYNGYIFDNLNNYNKLNIAFNIKANLNTI